MPRLTKSYVSVNKFIPKCATKYSNKRAISKTTVCIRQFKTRVEKKSWKIEENMTLESKMLRWKAQTIY